MVLPSAYTNYLTAQQLYKEFSDEYTFWKAEKSNM